MALTSAAPITHAGPTPQTVVSLTFDDGLASVTLAESMLAAHGMKGTFFINSGDIGTDGHLTWEQLYNIAAEGNEVSGHTLDHVDLTTIDYSQVQYQVCEDRARLLNHGFAATDFAYPYGNGFRDSTIKSIIQGCGYNSARRAWGLNTDGSCPSCPYAESIPPADPYATRAAWPNPQIDTTLDSVETEVTTAESHGGGWVQIVFHDLCEGCQQYSWTPENFQAFLDWLEPRASQGTVVETVAQVIGGPLQPSPGTVDTVPPTSSISCNGTTCAPAYAAPVQVALSATDTGGSGLEAIRYTTDGTSPTLASPVYNGPFSVSATTTVKYQAWDIAGNAETPHTQLIQIDTIPPTSSISCNGGACSSGWYDAAVQVTLSASDSGGSGVAAIHYTTDGTEPTLSSPQFSGPVTVSTTTTMKYRAWDNAGNVETTHTQIIQIDTVPPTSSISCNSSACSSGWQNAAVQVSLSATDTGGSGLEAIRYTTDGTDPTRASPVYSGPFTVSTTTTIKYRAWDNAGNTDTTHTQAIQIDTTLPTVAITSPLNGATVNGVVQVQAAATDSGSGIARVTFYVDGKSVSTSTNSPYKFAWNTKKESQGQHTLTAVAVDAAGNTASSATVNVTVK